MEFDDFWLLRQGWSDNLLYEQALLRKVTFIIASAWGAKVNQLNKAWPDPFGKGPVMVEYKGVQMTQNQARKLEQLKKLRSG